MGLLLAALLSVLLLLRPSAGAWQLRFRGTQCAAGQEVALVRGDVVACGSLVPPGPACRTLVWAPGFSERVDCTAAARGDFVVPSGWVSQALHSAPSCPATGTPDVLAYVTGACVPDSDRTLQWVRATCGATAATEQRFTTGACATPASSLTLPFACVSAAGLSSRTQCVNTSTTATTTATSSSVTATTPPAPVCCPSIFAQGICGPDAECQVPLPLVLAAGEALSFTHRVVRPGLPTAAQPLIRFVGSGSSNVDLSRLRVTFTFPFAVKAGVYVVAVGPADVSAFGQVTMDFASGSRAALAPSCVQQSAAAGQVVVVVAPDCATAPMLSVPALVGAVVGGLVLLALVGLVALVIAKRRAEWRNYDHGEQPVVGGWPMVEGLCFTRHFAGQTLLRIDDHGDYSISTDDLRRSNSSDTFERETVSTLEVPAVGNMERDLGL